MISNFNQFPSKYAFKLIHFFKLSQIVYNKIDDNSIEPKIKEKKNKGKKVQ